MMTDIRMTGQMDGIWLARHLHDRWPPIRIIVALARPRSGCAGLPENALFLPKPIHRKILRRT